jgi:hypothetical protein
MLLINKQYSSTNQHAASTCGGYDNTVLMNGFKKLCFVFLSVLNAFKYGFPPEDDKTRHRNVFEFV